MGIPFGGGGVQPVQERRPDPEVLQVHVQSRQLQLAAVGQVVFDGVSHELAARVLGVLFRRRSVRPRAAGGL